MPTIAEMIAQAKRDANVVLKRKIAADAKRKSRAIKKTKAKSKNTKSKIGLKALGY
jgi:hypothetical protein